MLVPSFAIVFGKELQHPPTRDRHGRNNLTPRACFSDISVVCQLLRHSGANGHEAGSANLWVKSNLVR
jgi:hypothetical protein